jgi:hypothetical protein
MANSDDDPHISLAPAVLPGLVEQPEVSIGDALPPKVELEGNSGRQAPSLIERGQRGEAGRSRVPCSAGAGLYHLSHRFYRRSGAARGGERVA